MKLDLHCHVKEGSPDSRLALEDYIEGLKSFGYDGMLITDHDSYNGYRYYEENLKGRCGDFVVLKGIEYDTLEAGHILVIMPTGVDMKIFEHKGLPLPTLIRIVHAYGGILGPAHPCGEPFLSIFSTGIHKLNHSVAARFDFIEGYNSGEDEEANLKAREIAAQYGKPTTGGSDSHRIECVGLAYTEIDENVSTEDELIAYIKAKKPMRCGGEQFMGTTKEHLGKFNKLLVYGFFPYNKLGAVKHSRKRKAELNIINWDLRELYKTHRDHMKHIEDMEKKLREDFNEHVGDILDSDVLEEMKKFRQHGVISTLEHCESVTLASDKLVKKLHMKNLDRRAMLRGAMLHDLYLYDWHKEDNGEHKLHGYHHADKARENAKALFDADQKEQSIIHSHMWPLNITRVPKSKEAWVVCLADKYVSLKETLFNRKK